MVWEMVIRETQKHVYSHPTHPHRATHSWLHI